MYILMYMNSEYFINDYVITNIKQTNISSSDVAMGRGIAPITTA